jgi:heterodisulfide reductase subunit A
MHEPTFRRACADGGLNPFFVQMANIREHCSWVVDDRRKATSKAKGLVAAAVQRVHFHQPLDMRQVQMEPSTLVVGAGIAGIEAALKLADSGKHVYLVERNVIGGHMAQLTDLPTLDCSAEYLPKWWPGRHPT